VSDDLDLISRREAVLRVSALLGGIALVGGSGLLTACGDDRREAARQQGVQTGDQPFTPQEVAFLDEVADTILPDTASSPGAKAAKTGAFMALMVADTYTPENQKIFRDGMRALDEESRKANNDVGFVQATPQQRLALLERIDREAKTYHDGPQAAQPEAAKPPTPQSSARPDMPRTSSPDADPRAAIDTVAKTAPAMEKPKERPPHYFRLMKQLAMLGYFTSEIGYNKAMRYVESPGRFDPCVPYTKGEKSWASHA
jgi:hypothetical protein